jgi:hypothetical protein
MIPRDEWSEKLPAYVPFTDHQGSMPATTPVREAMSEDLNS